jgi:galactose oxidase-like protein
VEREEWPRPNSPADSPRKEAAVYVLSWARIKSQRVSRFAFPFLLYTAVLLGALASDAMCLPYNITGRWTPQDTLTGTAVHMALLPGHGPYHSKVMWWYGLGHDEFFGGLLGWKPGEYDCGSYPDSTYLVPMTLEMPDSSGVFCSSESHLADGRLFLAGGTQPGTEFGTRHAYIFDPKTLHWTRQDSMSKFRWYPTSTTLADGKQLVTSGSQHQHIEFFGGLRGSESVPRDKGLFRYGVGANGVVDPAIYSGSGSNWPTQREGQSWVFAGGVVHMFGGADSIQYFDQYWQLSRANNSLGSDYDYVWAGPLSLSGPGRRWDHTAIATPDTFARMIIFGGIAKDENLQPVVMSDVWRLKWVTQSTNSGWQWFQVTTYGSETPGARCGQAAVWKQDGRRMLVFGGRGSTNGGPADASSTLWSLDFSSNYSTATWTKLSATGPSPRFHSGLAYEPVDPPSTPRDDVYLFGGEIAGGNKANDVWRLNLGTLTWTNLTDSLGGTRPSPRSRHTATLAGNLLYIFGGRSADDTMYVAHLEEMHPEEEKAWTKYRRHAPTLSGHTAVFWPGAIFERQQEIFNPSAPSDSQWTLISGAPRFQNWYPQMFTWKPDTVFDAGPDDATYKYSLNSPAWNQYPPGSTSGFRGGSAVMYRPGKVMKCGSRDIDGGNGASAVGTTKRIDLNSQSSAVWQASASPMLPRVNHNLVMLPNGKVLVVGGTSNLPGDASSAEKRPEIWDPDNSGGVGGWFGRDTLAAQHEVRDYHSTALLLPDGRVISAGGNTDTQKDVEIFCPPYLFNSDGSLATRPDIGATVQRARYGDQFSICMSDPTPGTIGKVCLIRPAAVTHGFDENQRYVPLTFGQSAGRINVVAPADSFIAPPGDYMLFIVNTQGVPAIARWMRVGSVWSTGDVTAPDSIPELHADYVTTSGVNLVGTMTGDDHYEGTASYVDIRYSNSAILNETAWSSAHRVSPEPVATCAGQSQSFPVSGLAAGHTYHFALKIGDDNGNWSALGDTARATTLNEECCGGEVRASVARDDGSGTGTEQRPGTVAGTRALSQYTGATPTGGGNPFAVEAVPSQEGMDLKVIAIEAVSNGDAGAASGVLYQTREASGAWATRFVYDIPSAARFALCAPEQATRWVFNEPLALEKVLSEAAGSETGWILDRARHSYYGDVKDTLVAGSQAPAMVAGDTLTAHYISTAGVGAVPSWVIVMSQPSNGTAGTRAGSRRQDGKTDLPLAFALHQNQPNPFTATTTIGFALPTPSAVKLEIFDLLGRRVRTLANALYPAGEHQVVWNRRTTGGALASPGLYFYRMDAGQYRQKKRMVILP